MSENLVFGFIFTWKFNITFLLIKHIDRDSTFTTAECDHSKRDHLTVMLGCVIYPNGIRYMYLNGLYYESLTFGKTIVSGRC